MVSSEDNLLSPAVPSEIPVMVLTDCHLFPGCLLPLFIYEERYQTMLRDVLSGHRLFCIGNRDGFEESSPVNRYSTVGLVRACVQKEDGTSQLLLLGMQRIKFLEWTQNQPYRVAKVEAIKTISPPPPVAAQLQREALRLFHQSELSGAQHLRQSLAENNNPELTCDILSYHFTRSPKIQQRLLGEPRLERRYEILIEALKAEAYL